MALDQRTWLSVYHALSNRARLGILILLGEARLTFSELKQRMNMTDGNLSYHLDIMFKARLVHNEYVKTEGTGYYSYYELSELGRRILQEAGLLQ